MLHHPNLTARRHRRTDEQAEHEADQWTSGDEPDAGAGAGASEDEHAWGVGLQMGDQAACGMHEIEVGGPPIGELVHVESAAVRTRGKPPVGSLPPRKPDRENRPLTSGVWERRPRD